MSCLAAWCAKPLGNPRSALALAQTAVSTASALADTASGIAPTLNFG